MHRKPLCTADDCDGDDYSRHFNFFFFFFFARPLTELKKKNKRASVGKETEVKPECCLTIKYVEIELISLMIPGHGSRGL